jgi:hypothetical protein
MHLFENNNFGIAQCVTYLKGCGSSKLPYLALFYWLAGAIKALRQ